MVFWQLQEAQQKIEELNKEQESLIDIFSEERERRDKEEENLRKKMKVSSLSPTCFASIEASSTSFSSPLPFLSQNRTNSCI